MPGHRRVVQSVTPQDAATDGRPYLYAYGRKWLAEIAGRGEQTVWKAVRDGVLDIENPIEAVCWALEKRKHKDLAAQVRAAFDISK